MSTRHAIRLADGRELIYFDDRPGLDRSAPDRRSLEPTRAASELRHDPVRDDVVIVAAHRQDRINLPATSDCPLCPSTAGHLTEIPADDYHVVAFENRFPSLGTEGAAGRCEVVCFTSDHGGSFAGLPGERLATIGAAWVDRTLELSRLGPVEQVFVFENRGEAIGATLQHPHGQIYAYPFVTSYTARALASAETWRARHGGCLFCDLVQKESAARVRVVAENERFVAFVPEAPRFPYEVHLYPRRHVPDLPALATDERDAMMVLFASLLRRFDGLFGAPVPYIAAWHQAPVRARRELGHLSLQILCPQRNAESLKFFAASEAAMGAYTIDIRPEDAAARLRGGGADF
jgi:UDPglucose--hexose-1-phosphate uridylyltransferase